MNYSVVKTKKMINSKEKLLKIIQLTNLYFKIKAYSFRCKSDGKGKNKMKGISKYQSKHIKFEDYKKCLDGNEYKKNVIITS